MITMRTLLLVLTLAGVALLAACGGQTAGPAVEEVDLATLADDVDVATVAAIRDNPGVFLHDRRPRGLGRGGLCGGWGMTDGGR